MHAEVPQKQQEKFCRTYDLTKAQPSSIKPFPHQTAALDKLHKWSKSKEGELGGILVLPTGGGKTYTAWHFLCSGLLSEGYKVLWLAHTHHLLEQAFYGLESEVGQIAKTRRQLTVRVVSGTIGHFRPAHIQPDDDILICTLQTITHASREKNKQFEAFLKAAGKKLCVVFDEAHHSPAPSYCRLIDKLRERCKDMRLLGLTATPTHTDKAKAGWLKELFPQGIIYQTTADKLIANNILAKPIFEQAPTLIEPEFDEQKYKDWVRDYRDLPEEIITKLAENQQRNAFIASTYAQNQQKFGKTIIFADRWFQCDYLREALLKHKVKAEVIYSHKDADPGSADARNKRTEDDNKQAIRKFRNNEIDVLINVRMLTEGTDIPDVNTVFLTRQTTSKILLTQMVGRALRGRAAGGTDQAYIVSFVDDWHHAIDWAEYELEGGTIDTPTCKTGHPPIHLVSIELVRQLARQMGSGININVEPFLKLMPIGWYRAVMETQAEGSGDTEVVQRLVMVFEQEKAGYEKFIDFLKAVEAKELEPFVEPDVRFDKVCEKLEGLQEGFFAGSLHIGGDLLTSLFYIVRHMAKKGREAPDWFEFEQRDQHDLDRFAEEMMNISMNRHEENIRLIREYEREDRYWKAIYQDYNRFWSHYNACVGFIVAKGMPSSKPVPPWGGTSPPASEPTDQVKQAVKLRDRYRCLCCGSTEQLQIDHIKPKHHGGGHEEANLQTLCEVCNRLKGVREISFVTHRSPFGKMPPKFSTSTLPQDAHDIEQWRQFLHRSINFLYHSAAVESVTIGQWGFYSEAWYVKLHPGNEPYWLYIRLRELQESIQNHRAQFKLQGPRKMIIKNYCDGD